MKNKRRGFLKAIVKGGCVFGAGVVGGIAGGVTRSMLDTGEKTLTSEEYTETFSRAIDRFMERYEIKDTRTAEELYALVIVESAVHGFGGGIVGPIFCMAANATKLPHFGKGGVVRGIFNIAMSSLVGNGAARATHEVVVEKGSSVFMTPKVLVEDFGLRHDNALRLCRDYNRGFYKNAGAGAYGSSIAYQAMHWLGQGLKAFSKRKQEVVSRESEERLEEGEIVDADFEKIFDDFQETPEQLAILEKLSTIKME